MSQFVGLTCRSKAMRLPSDDHVGLSSVRPRVILRAVSFRGSTRKRPSPDLATASFLPPGAQAGSMKPPGRERTVVVAPERGSMMSNLEGHPSQSAWLNAMFEP